MCTLSWCRDPHGFEVFCNRDERTARAPSQPPAVHHADGVQYVAALDGEAGGTWLAANEHGVVLSLLNLYLTPSPPVPDPLESRGRLVTGLAGCPSQAACYHRLVETDLSRYRPFSLACFQPDATVMTWAWDGAEIRGHQHREDGLVLTSSGADSPGAARVRGKLFADTFGTRHAGRHRRVTSEVLRELHRSHTPARDAYSVCMHRADAETVDAARVVVDGASVRFEHVHGPPCRGEAAPPITLARTLKRSIA